MTVIAWDGTTLAADRLTINTYVRGTTNKIFRLGQNELVGLSGDYDCAEALLHWLLDGREIDKWPASQSSAGWARAMVVPADRSVYFYERTPHSLVIAMPHYAIGIGRECAIGAMAAGADARTAVEIASRLIDGCGGGIDTLQL